MLHILLAADNSSAWSYLGYVALAASGFFVLFGARSNQSKKDLGASVTALQGRLDAKQDEIADLNKEQEKQAALILSQNQQITDLRGSVRTLERVVTGVDAINKLTEVVIAGFEHQGVPSEVLHNPES